MAIDIVVTKGADSRFPGAGMHALQAGHNPTFYLVSYGIDRNKPPGPKGKGRIR
jgi:hypothetical protein